MKYLVWLVAAVGIVGVAYAQHPQSHLQVQKSPDGTHILVLQTKTSHNVEGGRKRFQNGPAELKIKRTSHIASSVGLSAGCAGILE